MATDITTLPPDVQADLAELAAYRLLSKECLQMFVDSGVRWVECYEAVPHSYELSDADIREMEPHGAKWDSPPPGWGPAKLTVYSRGFLTGQRMAAGDLGQYLYKLQRFLTLTPIAAWHRWQQSTLCFVEKCVRCGAPTTESITGIDVTRTCSGCGHLYTYTEVETALSHMGGSDDAPDAAESPAPDCAAGTPVPDGVSV